MHIDVYEGTRTTGRYLLVRRGSGRVAAPETVRAEFVPGRLVTTLRMISTDTVHGLDVGAALGAIMREKYYVAAGPIDFAQLVGRRLQR